MQRVQMCSMKIGQRTTTRAVYVKIMQYANKKLATAHSITIYDTDAAKVMSVIKKALQKTQ